MVNNVKKYFLPLNDIPFNKIQSLEGFGYDFVQCEELRLDEHYQEYASLIWVKNAFHKSKEDKYLDSEDLIFGPVYSQYLSTRAKVKCVLKEKSNIAIIPENLPHLKHVNGKGKSWVIRNGKYAAMYGEETTREKVWHLEEIHIYCDWLLKLRVVIELLKQNVKAGKVSLDLQAYKEIAYMILRKEPALAKMDDSGFKDAVNNWVPSMVKFPLMEDIPKEYIGKAIE